MSLEEALAENTAALKAHTAALNGVAAAAKGATAKPAAAATKPAAAAKPAAGKAKPKAPTVDDIRAKFGGYLSTKDKELRELRLEQVAAINAHFGVAKASDLDPSLFAEALGYLATYEAGEEPEFVAADEAGDDEGEEGESLV